MAALLRGARNQEGLKRILEASIKHERQTKADLAAQRKRDEIERRILGELQQIKNELIANRAD